jgi:predicted DNA-binding transcriptional regulator AlpA
VPQDAPVRILTFAGLKECGIPYTRQHIGRLEAAGQFPDRIQLGGGRVGWIENEVAEWIRSRPRGPIDLAARKLAKGATA